MDELINELIQDGYLKTPGIIEAFKAIKREDFMPDEVRSEASGNYPLSIGHGQTISQPLTVAFMLELLKPEAGNKILDVGSGSGWQTALLAHIVGPSAGSGSSRDQGKVYAIERISELKEFGEDNTKKYDFIQKGIAEFACGDGSEGLLKEAPFDRIIVAAAAQKVPEDLLKQLKVGGRLVIPVGSHGMPASPAGGQEIVLIIKKGEDKFEEKRFQGFTFVPLINGG